MGRWQERQARREVNAKYKGSRDALKEALRLEPKVSHGTLYLGDSPGPFTYYLTQTRLIWNRAEAPDVDGFSLADVRRFVHHRQYVGYDEPPSLDIELEDGRQLRGLALTPSEVMGPGFDAHRKYVMTVIIQNMRLLGAAEPVAL